MTLTNKVAFLTGATRMGMAVATALAERGADVALAYRGSRDQAESVAEAVRALGRRAMVVQCDVTDEAQVQAATDRVAAELGRLDVLVAMASMYREVPFDDLDAAAFDRQLDIDLRGTFLCIRAAVPYMRAAGGGRIVTISDWTAASGRPRYKGYAAYHVAKTGVKALTESVALELAADGILVNAVAPGPMLPPEDATDEELHAVEKTTPLKRWGGATEVAKAILAFIDSDYTTGETFRVDGGRHVY